MPIKYTIRYEDAVQTDVVQYSLGEMHEMFTPKEITALASGQTVLKGGAKFTDLEAFFTKHMRKAA